MTLSALEALEAQLEQTTRPELPPRIKAAHWVQQDVPLPEEMICGLLDCLTKALVVGPSKVMKSFLMLMLALLAAAGREFLGYEIPKPRRVILWQAEVPGGHFHRRLDRMMNALGLTPDDIGDRLEIVNGRGFKFRPTHWQELVRMVKDSGTELLLLDPFYRFLTGNESDPEAVKALLEVFDEVAEAGCTVVYSHHSAKGFAGDRQAIDRASGTGILARDFDTQITLTPHVQDGLIVLEPICRNYPPQDAKTIAFNEQGCFELSDVAPIVRTSRNTDRTGKAGPQLTSEDALRIIRAHGPMLANLCKAELRKGGFTERGARNAIDALLEAGDIGKQSFGFPRRVYVGEPEAVRKHIHAIQNPKLPGVK